MGLIEDIIEFPKKYAAIPLKSALNTLFEKSKKRVYDLAELTSVVLRDYDQIPNNELLLEKSQFIIVPKNKQLMNKIKKSFLNCKSKVRAITSFNRHIKALDIYESAIQTALSKGVSIDTLITEKKKPQNSIAKHQIFAKNPNTEIKFMDCEDKFIELIFDNKEIFLMVDPEANILGSPALWSNNKSLIIALTACFNSLWEKTK